MWKRYKKGIKLNWWQAGLFKSSAVSFGVLMGIYFYNQFTPYLPIFIGVFLGAGTYILWLWYNQK
ncbi:MAG: hypothetical protein A3B38_04100 [Candidatus Levybacteria bacterium RIFCSPLOWO2_01_FULL_36_13]|nr:MAG: hypothetical protein A2684_01025 [Candidatus Levybacteria bacterium RIFCSPHIGHO2_01_FULL_36_15b]OGH34309.1 MAG: hypothetical protein A3B38_04100 [Candidatus Levybacteria bacterium RIFCSPLOWO2_01_FULL_36_13]